MKFYLTLIYLALLFLFGSLLFAQDGYELHERSVAPVTGTYTGKDRPPDSIYLVSNYFNTWYYMEPDSVTCYDFYLDSLHALLVFINDQISWFYDSMRVLNDSLQYVANNSHEVNAGLISDLMQKNNQLSGLISFNKAILDQNRRLMEIIKSIMIGNIFIR